MAWTKKQIQTAQIARRQVGWEEPQYRMVLRNIAGIRPWPGKGGKVSSTSPHADNAGFERFMAFCERHGYIDPVNGQGYWSQQALKQRSRMQYKVIELAKRGADHGLISRDALPAFVERMTAESPTGPTRNLEECDWEFTYKILEGLKAWVFREARTRGIVLSKN